MQYGTKKGQDIYDIAVITYGSPLYAVKLCTDNGIDLTSDLTGLSLYYDETIKQLNDTAFKVPASIPNVVDNRYTFEEVQSIYDLALMWGFGIDNCIEFFNKIGVNCDTVNTRGITFDVTKNKSKLSDFITLNRIKLATNTKNIQRAVWDGEYIIWDGEFILTWN